MKITRFVLSDYHQFRYLNINLTYPKEHVKAGQPLDKVCFIGKNGTGKTTILKTIKQFLLIFELNALHQGLLEDSNEPTQFCFEVEYKNKKFLFGKFILFLPNAETRIRANVQVLERSYYEQIPDFFENVFVKKDSNLIQKIFEESRKPDHVASDAIIRNEIKAKLSRESLLVYAPTEYNINKSGSEIYSLTDLNEGLKFGNALPYYHEISFDYLKNFWSLLIYQVQLRERERNEFENTKDNRKRTKEELIEIFEKEHPEILKIIAKKWDIILGQVGLYLDAENAKKPIVLTDQLIAYIKDKKNHKNIPFGALSSGIKNLIYSLGYLTSLYFNRSIKSSTVIFDEPEFSLFPDILLKLIDFYTNPKDFPNTQFFFATHSPLIASQFEPEERVCLHFDDERKVYSTTGIAPLGDDSSDLLLKDFGLEEVMPAYGASMWKKYLELKRKIDKEPNPDKIKNILKEFADLRQDYNFPDLYEPNK